MIVVAILSIKFRMISLEFGILISQLRTVELFMEKYLFFACLNCTCNTNSYAKLSASRGGSKKSSSW